VLTSAASETENLRLLAQVLSRAGMTILGRGQNYPWSRANKTERPCLLAHAAVEGGGDVARVEDTAAAPLGLAVAVGVEPAALHAATAHAHL